MLCCVVLCHVQGEIGGSNSVLSAMLNEVSPSTGDYVRIGNIYGQVMNLMIAGGSRRHAGARGGGEGSRCACRAHMRVRGWGCWIRSLCWTSQIHGSCSAATLVCMLVVEKLPNK
jgi:hypothetical protein